MPGTVNVFLVDSHAIYRRGLAECLRSLPGVTGVAEAESLAGARDDPAIVDADLILIGDDDDLPRARDFVREVGDASNAPVIVFLEENRADALDLVAAGAVGLLCKDTLTPEALAAAVQAAISGTSVIAPELLADLIRDRAPAPLEATERRADGPPWLTTREQQVLSLIAEGHPTREVAQRLCYSERTVKNVLHDVVAKLGARSRSQAVAHAVRDGLI
jgi:DNA-binding NarL/FixJ family response regulator